MTIRPITRANVIGMWFTGLFLIVVVTVAPGASVTPSTAALLLAMCLVPPAVVLKLWPSEGALTMAEAIREAKSR